MIERFILNLFIVIFFAQLGDVCAQLNKCSNRPCLNGGTCIDQPAILYGYVCLCPNKYMGYNCQSESDANMIVGGVEANNEQKLNSSNSGFFQNFKLPSRCLNGGYSSKPGLPCICPSGYSGNRCEFSSQNIDTCTPTSCRNNGQCIPTSSGIICNCYSNYYGSKCELMRNSDMGYNRILGISLGSILPFLFVLSIVGLLLYCCLFRKKKPVSDGNSNSLMGRAINAFSRQTSKVTDNSVTNTNRAEPVRAFPDPDEIFKVNSPPSYEEITRYQSRI